MHMDDERNNWFGSAGVVMHMWFRGIAAALKVDQGFQEEMELLKTRVDACCLENGAWRRKATNTTNRSKISMFLVCYGNGTDEYLEVPRYVFLRLLPHKGEEEAGKGFENGEGCVPGFQCVCAKWVCAKYWFRMEWRAQSVLSSVQDTEMCNLKYGVVFRIVSHMLARRGWGVMTGQLRTVLVTITLRGMLVW